MKKLQRVRTRRQLLRATTVTAASIPFLALAQKAASAHPDDNPGNHWGWDNDHRHTNQSCFLKGTKISTPSGDRLVQDLRIGDEVQTLAGRKTIKWIGYNKFTKEEGRPWQDSVMPIRVARFAIDDHTPYRDLYLSLAHCVFFNEALIPVMYLINEASIAHGTPSEMSALEYYHVELDTHEVIYAEGALVESYDGTNRDNFSNFIEYERLYGAERQSKMTPPPPWRLADLSFVPSGNGQEGATINGVEVVGDIGLSPPMALSGATLTRGRSCSEISVRKGKAGAAVESITAPPGSSATF